MAGAIGWEKAIKSGRVWGAFLLCLLLVPWSQSHAGAKRLRLGYFPNITHGQALYARATGELEKMMGVPIEWIPFNAGPSVIEALFVDALDAAFIGPSPTINGYIKSKGEKFVIVAGASSGGAGLVVRKDSGIGGEKDFHGKVIATPQLGNTQDLAARAWFAAKGYRLKETGGTVSLVPLSNPDQLTMFKKKQIDGAWTIEPWLSRLELEGGGRLFLDEKSLWPEGRYVTTHLVVHRKFLAENEELVKKLLTAHVELTQRMNADKVATARLLNGQLKKDTGKELEGEVISRALSRVEFTWDPIAPSMAKLAEIAHRIKFLRTSPRLDGIYELNPLNAVLRQKNLPEVSDGVR
ncbi:ABC transporter, substrate-binding protein [Geobacter metallireducens GS-15]|uniref:ABC transporter, substrate-binding protein n=1 Tax=Geobacter metallireducens (strain ATCC 53774 / DSM 7210 / GS-15) TaxID=269799 RepID=Q39WY6_GEOMG|nr:ABC transporter substrate-binding protein [Geobacter metallireducens]ABB31238.1 ABC transporter, substrate-binding protein [Geobacter metallireducens GS-15]